MHIVAIVPIKHESTRVPGKNYRLMNGKPLFHYILETLLESKFINEIVVDTNSPTVKDQLRKRFPSVRIYNRPEHLWDGATSTNTLLKNIIDDSGLEADLFIQTHATNPLLKSETIDDAINTFIRNIDRYDSLFSVKTHHTRFYAADRKELNHDRFNLIPTQDLDPIYEENSCIYLFSKETLFRYNSRIGKNPYLFQMDGIESQDIDWEDDFLICEQIQKLFIEPRICFLEMSESGPSEYHKELFGKDLFYVTFKNQVADDPNCLGFYPGSVWAETRNALARLAPPGYDYYCFMDDDIEFVSLTEKGVVQQLQDDLKRSNPAVLIPYYKNDDKELRGLKVGDLHAELFTNNCVKCVHKSLVNWFFPLPKIFHGTYDCAHLFNFLEIPFENHVLVTNSVLMINDVHNFNYTKKAKDAMEQIWKFMKPSFVSIYPGQNTFDIKNHHKKRGEKRLENRIDDYRELIDLSRYYDLNHAFFKKYRSTIYR